MERMDPSIPQILVEAYRAAQYEINDGAVQFTMRVDEQPNALQDLYRRTDQISALFITAYKWFGTRTGREREYRCPSNTASRSPSQQLTTHFRRRRRGSCG
jgi:hypothetical protein